MDHFKTSGIIPPIITPLTGTSNLDRNALERIIDHVITGGVNGIFLLGSTGEGASLIHEVRKHVIEAGVKWISNRVPVYINITSTSHLDSLRLAEFASLAGAEFGVLAPPFYFEMNQNELMRFYTEVADRSPLPLLLYNAPQYTKTSIKPKTVRKLASHQNIVGIKDSSGNMNYIRQLVETRQNESFSILVGPELMLSECLLFGCDGGICGGANLYPGLYAKIYQTALEENREELKSYQILLEQINTNVYQTIDSPMRIPIGIKYILSLKGICSQHMAIPVHDELSGDQKNLMDNLETKFLKLGY